METKTYTYRDFEKAYEEFEKNLKNSFSKRDDIAEFYKKWYCDAAVIISKDKDSDKICQLYNKIEDLALDYAFEIYYPVLQSRSRAENVYRYIEGLIDRNGTNTGDNFINPITEFFEMLDRFI